jgi:hypothetical protein
MFDTLLGQERSAVIAPLLTFTRTTASALDGASQTDSPSKNPP